MFESFLPARYQSFTSLARAGIGVGAGETVLPSASVPTTDAIAVTPAVRHEEEEEHAKEEGEQADEHEVVVLLVGHTMKKQKEGKEGLYDGVALTLRREPTNVHDSDAIAVYVSVAFPRVSITGEGGPEERRLCQCGYVQRTHAAVLAPALDDQREDRGTGKGEGESEGEGGGRGGTTRPSKLVVVSATLERAQAPGAGADNRDGLPVRLRLRLHPPHAPRPDLRHASIAAAAAVHVSAPSNYQLAAAAVLQASYAPPPTATVGQCPPAAARCPCPATDTSHKWLTHVRGGNPVAFALAHPPTRQSAHHCWVIVHSSLGHGGGHYSGKWMIMSWIVPVGQADRWFLEAAKAVEAGEFVAAKACAGGGDKDRLVILYVEDFRDRADVARAGRDLRRRFGDGFKLVFKADSTTIAGKGTIRGRSDNKESDEKTCMYTMRARSSALEVEEAVYNDALRLAELQAAEALRLARNYTADAAEARLHHTAKRQSSEGVRSGGGGSRKADGRAGSGAGGWAGGGSALLFVDGTENAPIRLSDDDEEEGEKEEADARATPLPQKRAKHAAVDTDTVRGG
jgi:hypothetical protein